MAYTRCRSTQATAFVTGLTGTIGYTLVNPNGSVNTARTTAGIGEYLTSGIYSADVAHPDGFRGQIVWDDGAGGYANYEINDVPSLILSTPANKLVTDAVGGVNLNLTQALDQNATGTTLGGALFASWASTWGKRILDKVAKTIKFYKDDNATVAKTVTLDSATVPSTVTP